MEDRGARQQRLQAHLAERRYREATVRAAVQLTDLLRTEVSVEDALPRAAVVAARGAYEEQQRLHLVWRRLWGVRLRDEMLDVARRVGRMAPGEARLVWNCWDAASSARSHVAVAFRADVEVVTAEMPQHLGPPPGAVGPGGVRSDLLLVTADGSSGVHLDYEHHVDRDEYEMLVWGAFARPVCR